MFRWVAVPIERRGTRTAPRVPPYIAVLLGLTIHFWPCNLAAQTQGPLAAPSPQPHASKPQPPKKGTITLKNTAIGGLVLITKGATPRIILKRLFTGQKVAIEWRNNEFANEKVYGAFAGSVDEIRRRLLMRANYVAVYATGGGTWRVVRIIVLGVGKASVTLTPQPRYGRPQQDLKNRQRRRQERRRELERQRKQRRR
jgi:hypothetical protein